MSGHVHICAPQPDRAAVEKHNCPTCDGMTDQLWTHTPWYGADVVCLACGEHWAEGVEGLEQMPRPFARAWRQKNIADAFKGIEQYRAAGLIGPAVGGEVAS